MEKFSYLLHREGRALYFAVLEQPKEWRGGPGGTRRWEGVEGTVSSVMSPEIGKKKWCTCGAPIEARTCGSTR